MPSVFIKNNYTVSSTIFVDTPNVAIRNSIVYGSIESEFNIEVINNGSTNVNVLNSILKTDENTSNANRYLNILKNPPNEIFNDADGGDFELYDNSRARNIGNITIGNSISLDLKGNSRPSSDGLPDVGAYEFQ